MKIKPPCVVSLSWVLSDSLNEELDVLEQPADFLIGKKDLLPVIQEALEGKAAGEIIQLQIEPENAFGDFDADLIFLESSNLFPKELEEGMAIEGQALPKGCNPQAYTHQFFTIAEIYPDHIILDGNHPLAGMAIKLKAKIHEVRPATRNELTQGTCGNTFFSRG